MSDLENILTDFISFTEKSAAVTNGQPASAQIGGATEGSGHSAQPTVRINQTSALSTQPGPQLNLAANKIPTSNAAPQKANFNSYTT